MNEINVRAIQAQVQLAEYVPGSSDEPDPSMRRCKCGCGRELPLYKRRAIARGRGKAHPSDRYFGLCWKKKVEEKIRKIPDRYAMKEHSRGQDSPNIKKPKGEIS